MSYGIGVANNNSPLWVFYVEQGKNINQCLSAGILLFAKPIKNTLFKSLVPLKLMMHFTTSSLTLKTIALVAVILLKSPIDVLVRASQTNFKFTICFLLLWPSNKGVTRQGVYPFLIGKSGVRVKPLTMSTSTFRHPKTWKPGVSAFLTPSQKYVDGGGEGSVLGHPVIYSYIRYVYSYYDVQDYRTLDFQRLTHYG